MKTIASLQVFATTPKVLVAEDHAAMRSLLGSSLRGAGYDVVEVQDGSTLWHELHRGLEDEDNPRHPDLVISDIHMPGADGLEVLSRLRDEGWPLPVILITSFCDHATRAEAERLGAALVLSKPFEVEALLDAARGLVSPEVV